MTMLDTLKLLLSNKVPAQTFAADYTVRDIAWDGGSELTLVSKLNATEVETVKLDDIAKRISYLTLNHGENGQVFVDVGFWSTSKDDVDEEVKLHERECEETDEESVARMNREIANHFKL